MKFLILAIAFGLALGCTSQEVKKNETRNPAAAEDVTRIFADGNSEGVRITSNPQQGSALFEYCTGLSFGNGSCETLGTLDKRNIRVFDSRVQQYINVIGMDLGRSALCGVTFGLSLLFTRNPFGEDSEAKNYVHLGSCSRDAVLTNRRGDVFTRVSPSGLRKFFSTVFGG